MAIFETTSKDDEVNHHPCVRNCCLDENDVCMGCFRHVNEITAWQAAPAQEKKRILRKAQLRRLEKQRVL